jgi:transposase
MEASTPCRWIKSLAEARGHEVVIANPRAIPLITSNVRKCDRNDARLLAELGQVRPQLLSPVKLREENYQAVRTLLFARQQLIKQRTALVNFVRAEVKALGELLPRSSTRCFVAHNRALIPATLRATLAPLLDAIQAASRAIDEYDHQVEQLSEESFPQTRVVSQVHGVGPLVALAFVATIGDPARFSKSRDVGAYLGLVPRMNQSGPIDPALSITKCGDTYMRSLLVSSATRILGRFGADSDLRRFGLQIIGSGGKRAKARARIAVARKLAVLLHRLLTTGEVYQPLHNSANRTAA